MGLLETGIAVPRVLDYYQVLEPPDETLPRNLFERASRVYNSLVTCQWQLERDDVRPLIQTVGALKKWVYLAPEFSPLAGKVPQILQEIRMASVGQPLNENLTAVLEAVYQIAPHLDGDCSLNDRLLNGLLGVDGPQEVYRLRQAEVVRRLRGGNPKLLTGSSMGATWLVKKTIETGHWRMSHLEFRMLLRCVVTMFKTEAKEPDQQSVFTRYFLSQAGESITSLYGRYQGRRVPVPALNLLQDIRSVTRYFHPGDIKSEYQLCLDEIEHDDSYIEHDDSYYEDDPAEHEYDPDEEEQADPAYNEDCEEDSFAIDPTTEEGALILAGYQKLGPFLDRPLTTTDRHGRQLEYVSKNGSEITYGNVFVLSYYFKLDPDSCAETLGVPKNVVCRGLAAIEKALADT